MLLPLLMSTVIATTSTGGNTVGQGGVIINGKEYVSSQVINIANLVEGLDGADGVDGKDGADGQSVTVQSNSEGSSVVDITTSVNGVVRHERIERPASSTNNRIDVRVEARSINGVGTSSITISTSTPEVKKKGFNFFFMSSDRKDSASSSASTTKSQSSVRGILSNFSKIFGNIFSFWHF